MPFVDFLDLGHLRPSDSQKVVSILEGNKWVGFSGMGA